MHRISSVTARRAALLLLTLMAFSGCKPRLIPDSSVPDSKQNRAVLAFLDQYRQAMESRSVQAVMDLVADDFFEKSPENRPEDEFGKEQLEAKLASTFGKVENLAVRFHVQNIERRNNQIEVVYYFVERALVKFPASSEWITENDVNRLVLRMKGKRYQDGFEILSGI